MGLTALQAQGANLGAAVAQYRGATTAARFGEPLQELAALREGCGVYDLGFRAKFSITGGDRVRWLNGMVTNNIRDLAVGHGVYAFLLNPQGHILGDLYVYNLGESMVIDTDRSQAETILATFDHYIIMDDVEVKDLTDEVTALGVGGPQGGEVLKAVGLDIPAMHSLQVHSGTWQGTDHRLVCGERGNWEAWISSAKVRQLWDALVAAGATPVGLEALEVERIQCGTPAFGIDIRDRDLPQETAQERALNFNKGCYIGQEIVERIRSRGAVHRTFTGFMVDDSVVPGDKISVGGKDVGEITSVAAMPTANKRIALGYVRREIGAPGREVMIGTAKATVVRLPQGGGSPRDHGSLEQRPA